MSEKLFYHAQSFAAMHDFSKRETSVFLGLVGFGTKHTDLAKELEISPNTLRIHLRNMNQKAGTSGVSSLLRKFIEYSFTEPTQTESSHLVQHHA